MKNIPSYKRQKRDRKEEKKKEEIKYQINIFIDLENVFLRYLDNKKRKDTYITYW